MKVPLIPLARDSVPFPGVSLRIPLSDRPDIPALLTSLFSRHTKPKQNNPPILVGCIPLCSPYLSNDGQWLLGDANKDRSRSMDEEPIDPAAAQEGDLFGYGTVAKVIGVQGKAQSEPYLLVEGAKRFSINKIIRHKPFLEAEVHLYDETGMLKSDYEWRFTVHF